MQCEKVADTIQRWMRERVTKAGARGVVVGVSGGIDSAVTAVLCKREFDENVTGLIMPCESLDDDGIDAATLCSTFAIYSEVVELGDTYNSMLKLFPETFDCKLARANLKSRLRMCALYYVANTCNYLVAGTSNLTEIELGYYTKYGDGGVDIEPIGSLYKTHVRKFAEHLGVPERILTKAPSAGLWEGQTDEKEIGMTYTQMDRALAGIDCQDGTLSKRMLQSQHKRQMPPCCFVDEKLLGRVDE